MPARTTAQLRRTEGTTSAVRGTFPKVTPAGGVPTSGTPVASTVLLCQQVCNVVFKLGVLWRGEAPESFFHVLRKS